MNEELKLFFTAKDSQFISVASLANFVILTLRRQTIVVILINKIKLNLRESEMKYLGIYIDQNLPWGNQIQYINNELAGNIRIINKSRYHVRLCTYFKGRVFRFLQISVFKLMVFQVQARPGYKRLIKN